MAQNSWWAFRKQKDTTLTRYHSHTVWRFLGVTFKQKDFLSKTRESQWETGTSHLLCSSEHTWRISHEAKFSLHENAWSSACFTMLTLRWICFSVLKTKQAKIISFMFKIILHFLDNNLYEGAAKLYRLGGGGRDNISSNLFAKKKGKSDPWCSPQASVLPSSSASWHIKGTASPPTEESAKVVTVFFPWDLTSSQKIRKYK